MTPGAFEIPDRRKSDRPGAPGGSQLRMRGHPTRHS